MMREAACLCVAGWTSGWQADSRIVLDVLAEISAYYMG